MKRFSRTRKTAVLVYDGEHWHGGVFVRQHGEWSSVETQSVAARSLKQLPSELLDWMQSHGVKDVRLLVPADVRSMQMEMPEDFEMDELHTALSYELAGETGVDAHLHRLATVSTMHCGLGGDLHSYLVAEFDLRQMEMYQHQLGLSGLQFEAIGALEMGVMGAVQLPVISGAARAAARERIPWAFGGGQQEEPTGAQPLLLLRNRSGFLVLPPEGEHPHIVAAVQVGLLPSGGDKEGERIGRLQRKLQPFAGQPVQVVTPAEEAKAPEERIRKILQDEAQAPAEFVAISLRALLPEMMRMALRAPVGDCHTPCPMVGLPPQPRDPHRAGTLIAGMIILVTALHLVSRWWMMAGELRDLKRHNEQAQALAAVRKSANDQIQALLERRQETNERYAVLQRQGSPLPDGLLLTLDTLAQSMPPYTRITRIRQEGSEPRYEIEGTTRWAEGKNRLARSLIETLRQHQFVVESGKVEMQAESREQSFTFRIHPSEGGRRP